MGDTSTNDIRSNRGLPLVGVLLGAGIIASGMVCLYLMMRWVGLENGGACASGGPYVIREGQECQDGVFALGFGGGIGVVVGALLYLWGSWRHGGSLVTTSASSALFGGFFGALGASFLSVKGYLSKSSVEYGDFTAVGYTFLALAAGGAIVAIFNLVYALRTTRTDVAKPSGRTWLQWIGALVVGVVVGVVATSLIVGAVS